MIDYKLLYGLFIGIFILMIYRMYKTRTIIHDNNSNIIQVLVRSTARWSLASLQDKSPLVAVLHANYGTGYLWALREVFTDTQIQDATGVNIIKFEKQITQIQDRATKMLMSVCPKFSTGLDLELAKIAGNV